MTIKANISSRVRIGGTGLPVLLPKPVGVISGPSVLPWRIDREDFMVAASDWLSAPTLKVSYGAQGNDNLGTYYASSGLYSVVSNNGENALVSDRLATPKLKWETNLELQCRHRLLVVQQPILRFIRFLPAAFERFALFPSAGSLARL